MLFKKKNMIVPFHPCLCCRHSRTVLITGKKRRICLRTLFNFIANACMYLFFWKYKIYTYLVCATMTCVLLRFFFMEFYFFHWIFSTASISEFHYLLIAIKWYVLIPWGFSFLHLYKYSFPFVRSRFRDKKPCPLKISETVLT